MSLANIQRGIPYGVELRDARKYDPPMKCYELEAVYLS